MSDPGLEAGPQQEMRALLVIHAVSRPKRSGELEEVYDHLGEMIRRERAVAAPPQHEFEVGQRRQGLGGPKRLQAIRQVELGKDGDGKPGVEGCDDTRRACALQHESPRPVGAVEFLQKSCRHRQ